MAELTDHKGRPRVVITGLGLVSPVGTGVEVAWSHLIAGKSGIGPIERFDASEFKTKFAGESHDFDTARWFDKKELRRNDRFILMAVAAAEMAREQAGLQIDDANADRVGVIVGAGLGGLETIERTAKVLAERGPNKITPFFIPGLIVNLAAGQISIRSGARGPNWGPVSACATSAHALGEATEMLRRGVCDVAISGGAEATITPLGVGGFNAMKALSTRNDDPERASRPWDVDRDGFVMGEGAGIMILETAAHATARGATILAELSGYGATSDAGHITAPDGKGAARCMDLTLADAGITPSQLDYINAHGTSTPVGDEKEIEAIKAVFKDDAKDLVVSSTKSMHGHLLGASGAVEGIICVKALEEGVVPPTINLETPSPNCDLDLVPKEARKVSLERVMSNSFGFGGTNTSLIFNRYGV